MRTEKIVVSEDTARFVECLKLLQEISGKFYDALEIAHGSMYADNVMRGRFYDAKDALQGIICEYLNVGILESLSIAEGEFSDNVKNVRHD